MSFSTYVLIAPFLVFLRCPNKYSRQNFNEIVSMQGSRKFCFGLLSSLPCKRSTSCCLFAHCPPLFAYPASPLVLKLPKWARLYAHIFLCFTFPLSTLWHQGPLVHQSSIVHSIILRAHTVYFGMRFLCTLGTLWFISRLISFLPSSFLVCAHNISVCEEMQRLGVVGWMRNTHDGRVQTCAQANAEKIEEL